MSSEKNTDLVSTNAPENAEVPEHPRADEIRRQVEYYFSDANLPYDEHMLEQCNGIENKPVSIKRICGFKKMRPFKPLSQVIEALKRSAFLDVTEDRKGICRKIPLRPWQLAGGDVEEEDSEPEVAEVLPREALPQPEKKFEPVKDTNPYATKNLLKPTGFEEFFAEAPITPEEFQDDTKLYEPASPFSERIESAIQRFKLKKKMHQEYARVFNRFMKFGGVEYREQFSGVGKKEIQDKDAYELARLLATHYVSDDKENKAMWRVDFEGVAKAFLSSQFPVIYGDYTVDEVKRAAQVLRTFYNYIMHHNVCPEYTSDILAARSLCDLADLELPKVQAVGYKMPGAFNVACSVLVGGQHASKYIGNQDWAKGDRVAHPQLFEYVKWTPGQGFSSEEASIVTKAGIMILGDDEQCDYILEHKPSELTTDSKEHLGLEVVKVERATPDAFEFCNDHNKNFTHKLPLSPLGKLSCKSWLVPDFQPWDISVTARARASKDMSRVFEFWIEDHILEDCFVGMKMEATIERLNIGKGIWILENVSEVKCSFFQWLPNELLMGDRKDLKAPQVLPYGKGGVPPEEEVPKKQDSTNMPAVEEDGSMVNGGTMMNSGQAE